MVTPMITPEYQPSSSRDQLQTILSQVQHKLEINDENENQIERSENRDSLLEQQDALLEMLSALDSHEDPLTSPNSTT
jgi:hypothetical protein